MIEVKQLARKLAKFTLKRVVPPHIILWSAPRDKRLALTFDDGPHPENTPRLLDLLEKFNVSATFFVIGQEAEKHPRIMADIVARGHALGNHSYTHTDRPIRDFDAEIGRSMSAIENFAGNVTKLFRPPYGMLTLPLIRYCRSQNTTIVLWSFDTFDYDAHARHVIDAQLGGVRSGDVILMHDDTAMSAEIIACHLPRLLDSGFNFATVAEMITESKRH